VDEKKKQILNERSKTRLKKECKKRIQTTMIGALSSVEKFFGNSWGDGISNPTHEQIKMRDIFEELRTEILDKGNNQIRLLEAEIENYEVIWSKYHINLPIQRFIE